MGRDVLQCGDGNIRGQVIALSMACTYPGYGKGICQGQMTVFEDVMYKDRHCAEPSVWIG